MRYIYLSVIQIKKE